MFEAKRILTLDVGASKVALAEFVVGKTGTQPELTNYGIGQIGIEPDSTDDPSPFVVAAVRELMRERGIKPAPLIVTLSGQTVFPRYVKLPPVSGDKIGQIVQYEAEQNVPFDIKEVVWDYQIVGQTDEGDLNVMLVAAKNEHVTSLTRCVQAVDLEPETIDVAPMALYNCVRFNYLELEGCTLVLDIGSRSSNLIFIEEGRMFSRSIPIAGNAITQEIMKEFEISFLEAEETKREHAFVAFGGVYAGPDNETADRVSKITRNVVTRLHAEVNRSINFYRSQQGGSAPQLILLTGGSSIIPHMDTFFREKLKVAVEYLNPFVNVPVRQQIDAERIEGDLQVLGECVGMALRHSLTCPVEINLMPEDLLAKKQLRRRLPFFVMSAVGVALIMLCWWGYAHNIRNDLNELVGRIRERTEALRTVYRGKPNDPPEKKANTLKALLEHEKEAKDRVDSLAALVETRTSWMEVLAGVHETMKTVDGVWLRGVKPILSEVDAAEEAAGDASGTRGGNKSKDGKKGKGDQDDSVAKKTVIQRIDVSGKVFYDKLDKATEGPTPVEVIAERLRQNPLFGAATSGKLYLSTSVSGYAHDFTIHVVLEHPIPVR